MTYDVLVIVALVNVVVTLVLWQRVSKKTKAKIGPNKKAAQTLWRSDPIVPKHNPPKIAGGDFSSMADDIDRRFFEEFREFAYIVNSWLADEFTASRFRLQDSPAGDLSLNVNYDDGPSLGRSFEIYYNQMRLGALEISPSHHEYTSEKPEVFTSVEVNWPRLIGFDELTDFLNAIAIHVTSGSIRNNDYLVARLNVQTALTRTLWDHYRLSQYDGSVDDDDDWGELRVSFQGPALYYFRRRETHARSRA